MEACASSSYCKSAVFFGVRRVKEFKVLKWFMNMLVLFLIEKCVSLSILVEDNLFRVIKLQPDLTIRAILQVASILRSKPKIEIERKFY